MEAHQHHPVLMEVMRTDVEQLEDMRIGEVMVELSEIEEVVAVTIQALK